MEDNNDHIRIGCDHIRTLLGRFPITKTRDFYLDGELSSKFRLVNLV